MNFTLQTTDLSTVKLLHPNSSINSLRNITTDEDVKVTPTKAEEILLTAYLLLAFIWITFGNLRILYLIIKNECYHTPYFVIISSYALTDAMQAISLMPLMFASIILQSDYDRIPWIVCKFNGVFSPALIFFAAHILGVIAAERYYYFVQPLKYPLKITMKRTIGLLLGLWTFSFIFSIIIELFSPKEYKAVIMACQTDAALIFTFLQTMIYTVPSFCAVTFSIYKLWQLQSTHNARVADVMSQVTTATNIVPKAKSSTRTAIKIILLTSGSFWITFVPPPVIRIVVFSEYTWTDLNTFRNPKITYLFRYFNIIMFTVSSFLNPIIYLYTDKSLYDAFFNRKKPNGNN